MSKYFCAVHANCPYYKGEYNRSIYCDIADGSQCAKVVFGSLTALKGYRKQKCECRGRGCVIAMGMKIKAEL